MTDAKLYRHSGDSVTDRIIGEFADFAGWTDEPPLTVDTGNHDDEFGGDTTKRDRPVAAPKQDTHAKRQSSRPLAASSVPVQTESPLVCPSCRCTLPDPDHLVSSSMIDELRRARATSS